MLFGIHMGILYAVIWSYRVSYMYINNLKRYRELAGLTQKDVEETLGLRRLSMRDYESERLKLPAQTAVELARLYGVSVDELLSSELTNQKGQLDNFNEFLYGNSFFVIYSDAIIKAFFEEIEDVNFKDSLFEILTSELSLLEKRSFKKYLIHSLMALACCDRKIHDHELVALKKMSAGFGVKIKSPNMLTEVKPDHNVRALKHLHLRHYMVWLMFFFAYADGEASKEEVLFIEKYASEIKMNRSNFLKVKKVFIKEKL